MHSFVAIDTFNISKLCDDCSDCIAGHILGHRGFQGLHVHIIQSKGMNSEEGAQGFI